MNILMVLTLTTVIAPIPVMIRHMMTGRNSYRGVLEGIFCAVIGIFVLFALSSADTGLQPFDMITADLDKVTLTDMALVEKYQSFGSLFGGQTLNPEQFQEVKILMARGVPGSMILFACLIAYLNYRWISWVLRQSSKKIGTLPPFWMFSLPRSAMLGSLLIYLLALMVSSMGIVDENILMYTFQVLFLFAFSLQGLAVISFYGTLKKMPKIIIMVFCSIFILTAPGHTFLFLLGLSDLSFDLRRRISRAR